MRKVCGFRLSRQNRFRFRSSGGKTRYRLAYYQCCGGVRCFQFHSQTGIWKQKSVGYLSSPHVMFKNDSSYSRLSGFHVNYLCIMCVSFVFGGGRESSSSFFRYTGWFKKMDSISYIYISWTIHGMWMIYITFERGGPKFSNTTARVFA